MEIETYDPKAGYQARQCQICNFTKVCCQHHLHRGAGRSSSKVIWICIFDGFKEGCHERIHRDPAWAYRKGYLIRNTLNFNTNTMTKEKKSKQCEHTKTMNSFEGGKLHIKCIFCKKEINEMRNGKKKPHTEVAKTPAVKIGYEKQDPRIKEAELLKRQYVALRRKINKGYGTPAELAADKERVKVLLAKMKSIESSYEE